MIYICFKKIFFNFLIFLKKIFNAYEIRSEAAHEYWRESLKKNENFSSKLISRKNYAPEFQKNEECFLYQLTKK